MHELLRLIRRGRAHRVRFVLGAMFAGATALCAGFTVWVVKAVVDGLAAAPELRASGELNERILLLVLGLPLLAFVAAAFDYGSRISFARAAQGVLADMRADLYASVLHRPMSWLKRKHPAEMASRITNDVQRLEIGLTLRLGDLATNAPQVPIFAIVLWWLSWKLAIVVSLVMPIAAVLVRRWGRKIKGASRKAQEQVASLASVLSEALQGIRIVKMHGAEGHEERRFGAYNETVRRTALRAYGTLALSSPVLDVIGAMAIAVVLAVAALEISAGRLDLAEFTAFFTGITVLYKAVKKTASSFNELQNSTAAAARCFEILDDQEHEPTGRVEAGPLRDGIELRHVSFAYADATVLNDVSFRIPKGRIVALVGESGSGKTTLTHLVARFHDVTSGSITWDGTDLREITPASLRASIALVTQDTVVFDDTVTANIAYADPAPDAERVRAAARAAHADEFVQELESGYDTRLGQGGNRLSGGQRQRIAIARALYKDAPLLILDEATSHLDSQSEALVQDALARLLRGRTALVVAHRLSTVQAADVILVLAAGRVVQQGTHADLVAQDGPYRRLHLLQSGQA